VNDLLLALRAATMDSQGILGLAVIAVAASVALLADRERRGLRIGSVAAVLAGMATFAAAVQGQRAEAAAADFDVLLIDKTKDYRQGLPGGLFNPDSTIHMMRYRAGGDLWAPAGGAPYGVSWAIPVTRPGRFRLFVQYGSIKSRPSEIRLGGVTLFTGLARTTRSPGEPEWFEEGTVELHTGINYLSFYRDEPLPWINAVRLVRLPPGEAPTAGQ
jgi:hypothetical protein